MHAHTHTHMFTQKIQNELNCHNSVILIQQNAVIICKAAEFILQTIGVFGQKLSGFHAQQSKSHIRHHSTCKQICF